MGKGGDGSEENMAAWLVGINTLKIQPFKLPPLGPHDVRIRMKAVGICGSDVHFLKKMQMAHFVVKEPMVIGHECAGVIEDVGSEVKSLVAGDRVAIEPGISCWRCRHCKGGRYNLCDDMKFFATPPVHGSLANQIVHPADLCFKLPDNVSLEEGAMCEPLSVGVHACRRAVVGPATNVLIVGAGPIGLVSMLSARAFGSPRIIIVDVDDYRLSFAKSLGADDVVKVSTNVQWSFFGLCQDLGTCLCYYEGGNATRTRPSRETFPTTGSLAPLSSVQLHILQSRSLSNPLFLDLVTLTPCLHKIRTEFSYVFSNTLPSSTAMPTR